MSLADDLFINMCKDIIDNGYSTEGRRSDQSGKMEHMPTP